MLLKSNYIKGLDGLRFFSILIVLTDHLGIRKILNKVFDSEVAERLYLSFSGKAGVSVFFVISGFLITSILIKEISMHGRINFRKFFIRRFLRLFPAFCVFMIAILLFFIAFGRLSSESVTAWVLSLVYLYNFVPYGNYRVAEIGHTWSLAIEEQFYLFWPIAMNLIKFNWIKYLLMLIIGLILIFKLFYDRMPISTIYESYRISIPGMFPILLGCIVAFVIEYKIKFKNGFGIIGGIILFCFALWFPISDMEILHQLNFIVQPIGVALFIFEVSVYENSKAVKLLELSWLVFLGKLSYSLYLWQGLFLKNGPGSEIWIQQFPQNIILTFLFASLSYFLIEKKFINLKKKFRVVDINHD